MTGHVKELSILLAFNSFVSLLSYVSTIGIANKLGASGFGEYSYVMIMGLLLAQFVSFGSDEAMPKMYLQHREEAAAALLKFKAINYFLLLLLAGTWAYFFGEHLVLYSLLVASQALSIGSVYEAHRENAQYARVFAIERCLYMVILWGGIWFFEAANLAYIFWSLFFCTTLSTGFQLVVKRSSFSFNKSRKLVQFWRIGSPVLIFSLSKYMYGGGVRIAIQSSLGYSALGNYSAAWQFVPIVSLFMAQITKSWRFKITQTIHDVNLHEFKLAVRSMCLYAFLPIAFLSLLLAVGGPALFARLFSPEFSMAPHLIPWICIYFLVVAADVMNSMLWIALGRVKQLGLTFFLAAFFCFAILWLKRSQFDLADFLRLVVLCHGGCLLINLISVQFLLRRHFSEK